MTAITNTLPCVATIIGTLLSLFAHCHRLQSQLKSIGKETVKTIDLLQNIVPKVGGWVGRGVGKGVGGWVGR